MTYRTSLFITAMAALAACGSTSSQTANMGTQCTQLDPQAQSLMVGSASNPVRCGPQQGTVAVPEGAMGVQDPVAATEPLVVVPNQTGPAIAGQITQAEADLLASQGVPATQENIDFIRLAVQ